MKIINSVEEYWLIGSYLIILSNNKLIDTNSKKEVLLKNKNSIMNSGVFFSDVYNNTANIYNLKLELADTVSKENLVRVNYNANYFILRLENGDDDVFEYHSKNISKVIPFKYFNIIDGNFLVFGGKISAYNKISRADIDSFKISWSFSLSHYPKFINFVGDEREVEIEGEIVLFEERLYFRTNNYMFFCLDVKTGKEIWSINIENMPLKYQILNDKFVFLHWSLYLEVNINTGEILTQRDVKDLIFDNDMVIDELTIYRDEIYFLDSRNFLVGKYKPIENKLEKVFKVPTRTKKPWKLEQMKIHENKIYVLELVNLDRKDLYIIDLVEMG